MLPGTAPASPPSATDARPPGHALARRGLVARVFAAVLVTLALWAGGGVLTVTEMDGPRAGLLPAPWVPAVILPLLTAVLVLWRRAPVGPLCAAAVLLLVPWLPLPIPHALLLWTAPLTRLLAGGLLIALAFHHAHRLPAPLLELGRSPRRAPLMVAALSVVLYGAAAWRAAPFIPGGDETHYLVITQSLLYDRDLRIENNHVRGDYRSYHAGDLRPDYVVRGVDGEIYSIHMPGVSALVAPGFLLAGHPGAAAVIVVMGAAAGALLWWLAWAVTGSAAAAWFGWSAASLSVPVAFHSFTLFPDSAGILPVLVGFFALLQAGTPDRIRPWVWSGCGAMLALLPWLHARFALIAAVLGALIMLRLVRAPGGWRPVAAFTAVPLLAAPAWFGFFHVIYGSPDPRAQYGDLLARISSIAYVPGGIGGLLFDSQFGVLPHAPVLGAAAAGTFVLLTRSGAGGAGLIPSRLLGFTLLLLVIPYVVSTTTMRMWWGGWSAPGRFVAPLIPPLGIAVAVAWAAARRPATRALLAGALGLTLAVTAALVWVDRGRLAYNVRQAETLWLEWAGPLVALTRGLPTFLRTPEPQAWLHATVWVALLTAAWLAVRAADRRVLRGRLPVAAALASAAAAAAMIAVTAVWRLGGVASLDPAPSQVRLLTAAAADRRAIGIDLGKPAVKSGAALASELRIEPPARAASRRSQQLGVLAGPLPAGEYIIDPEPSGAGTLTVGIGRTHFPIARLDASGRSAAIRFPVDVRALFIQGDAAAMESVRGVTVRLASLPRRSHRIDRIATQAVRYGASTAFFVDGGSFPEPDAFWVEGARETTVVVHPDGQATAVRLFLRNAPVPNRVTLAVESGGWRHELQLQPWEERDITVPVDGPGRVAVLRIGSSSGFRPSEHAPSNGDRRFLGVWVTIR